MTTKIPALLVSLLIACGSKSAPPTTTTTPPASGGAPLTIVELKILDGDEPGLLLHANGNVEMNRRGHKGDPPTWTPMAKLSADGKMAKTDGTDVGALQADGTFKLANGETAPFKLDGDVLVAGDKRISIDDKGVLQGGNPGFQIHVEGATDAGSRRAALLIFAISTAHKKSEDKPPVDISVPAQVSP